MPAPDPDANDDPPAGREVAKVGGLLIAVVAIGFVVAYQFVGPPPPKRIVLATGSPDGACHAFGPRYAEALAEVGLEVELATSAGSLENLEKLRSGAADVAFV
jgi:TRAP-type uncharacterized transport system substrate-binding protein